MKEKQKRPVPSGYIFRSSITLRDGTKIFAKDRGKKAFLIPVGLEFAELADVGEIKKSTPS